MKKVKIIAIVIGVIVGIQLLTTVINILQKGSSVYGGQTMTQILGVPAEKATPADIEKLSKAQLFQLFYAAKAPAMENMKGEYKAQTLSVGIQAASADFYTHHVFGPGRWVGKAFTPNENEKDKGNGYNLFKITDKGGKDAIARTRRMNTSIGKSPIDGKESYILDYSPYNGGTVHSMQDEIRKVNDTLFICMGYMGIGGGSINPAPFILFGEASPWVGPDEK